MKRIVPFLLVVILCACVPNVSTPVAAEVTMTATDEPAPTNTNLPSPTSTLTLTLSPTPESQYTPTPRPTRTPFVTYTALPTAEVALRQSAAGRGIELGAAVAVEPLRDDPDYRQVLGREFNLITAENVMKFNAIEPKRGEFDFRAADELVEFAAQNGMRVRGHTFVWHQALPDWLTNGGFSRDEMITILRDHISAEARHFKGKVFAWDVVNEAFEDTGALRSTPWSEGIGSDYVEIAFRAAREADPDALLFYNDYNAEGMNAKSDAVYALVKDLKEKGLIDGVGLQMHVDASQGPARADLEENMRRLGELGLVVHITEMDVKVLGAPTQRQLEDQAAVYRDVTAACLSVPACKAIVFWGFTDRYSWIPIQNSRYGTALPFDENYLPKPAYHAIRQVLAE